MIERRLLRDCDFACLLEMSLRKIRSSQRLLNEAEIEIDLSSNHTTLAKLGILNCNL